MRARLPLAGLFAAAAPLAVVAWAAGEPARVELDYQIDPNVEGCPSTEAVRQALAAKLGYDPFAQGAEHRIELRVRPRVGGLEGSLELKGPRTGRRQIDSPENDCREVVDALVVAAAIAIDPTVLVRPPSSGSAAGSAAPPLPPDPLPPPEPAPVKTPDVPPASPVPAESPRFAVLGGGTILVGELPGVAVGFEGGGRVGVGAHSLALTGLFSNSTDTDRVGPGYGQVSLLAASLIPCAHLDAWSGCLLGSLGVMKAEGVDLELRQRVVRRTAATGALVAYDLKLNELLSFGVYTGVVVPLIRTTVRIDGQDVWSTSSVAGRFGGRILFSF